MGFLSHSTLIFVVYVEGRNGAGKFSKSGIRSFWDTATGSISLAHFLHTGSFPQHIQNAQVPPTSSLILPLPSQPLVPYLAPVDSLFAAGNTHGQHTCTGGIVVLNHGFCDGFKFPDDFFHADAKYIEG